MKKIRQLPTILALFILLAGMAGGVLLIRQGSQWFTRASPTLTPKQIKITNISNNSLTVSWITDGETAGFVKYGPEANFNLIAKDDRDQISGSSDSFSTHHVTLRNLNSSATYYFKIFSGNQAFENNGQPYQATTAPAIQAQPPNNDVAYGKIESQAGVAVENTIVYLSLANTTPQSTLTTSSGTWTIPLNTIRSTDLSTYAAYDHQASLEEIFVQAGSLGTATAIAVTKNDSPMPNIILGESFDFRSPQQTTQPTPTSPARGRTSSGGRFNVDQNTNTDTTSFIISNPEEKEGVTTQKPEIFGIGPASETFTITINSPQELTGQVTINPDGTWNWTPPENLESGEHTLTATLADGRIFTRLFTVLAAETDTGSPSFTATPSATLAPSPTPATGGTIPSPTPSPLSSPTPTTNLSPTPTATSASRTSMPSTDSGVPSSGHLTPTFLVSIMGLTLIVWGLYYANHKPAARRKYS